MYMHDKPGMNRILKNIAAAPLLAGFALSAFAQSLPAPGVSARIDAIKKSGELRVAVLSNQPWLVENTSGDGAEWSGPAWLLAQEYARLLGVKLRPVRVSHETKVPVLASNQVDMTISPLSQTPERLKVVDFVLYAQTSLCMFGRADNPKFSSAKSFDDFNRSDVTIAYFTGGGEENWVKQRFPKANLRGVSSSGAAAPLEEITARRADAVPLNRVPWISLNKKVKGLAVLPKENNCQGSTEMATPIGLAVNLNQPAYVEWLRAVAKSMQPKLTAEEQRMLSAN